jgi:S1-C subfamily serine protease
MMSNFLVAGVIAMCITGAAAPDAGVTPQVAPIEHAPTAVAAPVFAELSCRVTRPSGWFRSAVDVSVKRLGWGSAFAYRAGNRVLLVTAAHVVSWPQPIDSLTDEQNPSDDSDDKQYKASDGYKFEPSSTRIRIGGLAVQPKRVLIDESRDIALLEISDQDLTALQLEILVSSTVVRDAEVKIWGFPAVQIGTRRVPSASQSSQRSDVTDVRPGEVICAPLNGVETRGGFSGGPLIAANGKVVGMIMRSTSESTRCRSMAAIDELAKTFDQRATLYSESSEHLERP